jgi:hypothetical protein
LTISTDKLTKIERIVQIAPVSASAQDHAFSYLGRPAFHLTFSSCLRFHQENSPGVNVIP